MTSKRTLKRDTLEALERALKNEAAFHSLLYHCQRALAMPGPHTFDKELSDGVHAAIAISHGEKAPESPAKEQPGQNAPPQDAEVPASSPHWNSSRPSELTPLKAAPNVAAMVKRLRGYAMTSSGSRVASELMSEAAALIEKLGHEWIPVSERLPARPDWYGVIDADGEKRAARWHSDGFWIHQVVEPIKYWCELPPPPERS